MGGAEKQLSGKFIAVNTYLYKEEESQDFPHGPVVKTPLFQCRGCRFGPWSGY